MTCKKQKKDILKKKPVYYAQNKEVIKEKIKRAGFPTGVENMGGGGLFKMWWGGLKSIHGGAGGGGGA